MRTAFVATLLLALAVPMSADTPAAAPNDNPLLTEWSAPFGVPPFERIRPEHYLPAFREAIRLHDAEIAAIVAAEAAPTFANTVVALDDAGELLTRVNNVFGVVSNAETTEALQEVEEQVKPLLAAHADDTWLNAALFRRVKAVYDGRDALHAQAPRRRTLLEQDLPPLRARWRHPRPPSRGSACARSTPSCRV